MRGMKVCDLYEGSSSYWSTLKIDDIVCAVDGQDIRHGPPSLVLQLTNGAIGTSMCLHVIRREAQDDEISGALSARGECASAPVRLRACTSLKRPWLTCAAVSPGFMRRARRARLC